MALALEDKQALGIIARAALAAAVGKIGYQPADPGRPGLQERRGCFVTLRTHGRLRGCIGCFTSDNPLWETVAEYTQLSALEDPRFHGQRLKPEELPEVEMEISALSPLEPCREPEKITLGVHGIYVTAGGRSGCFLPQVATETGWNVEEFWGHCCRDKAGLPWDAWTKPGVTAMTFTAEAFAV